MPPLSEYEQRVLAEIEADLLADADAHRARYRSARQILLFGVLVAVAIALAVLTAVRLLAPAPAAVLDPLAGLLVSVYGWWIWLRRVRRDDHGGRPAE